MPGQIGGSSLGVTTYGGASPLSAQLAPGTRPVFQLLAALDTTPLQLPVWTDITEWMDDSPITTAAGFDDDLQHLAAAGTMTLRLRDPDRTFDPSNVAGPFYGKLKPWNGIRLAATYAGLTTNLFTGFVRRWPQNFDAGQRRTTVNITAVDITAWLALESTEPRNVFTLDDPVLGQLDVGNQLLGVVSFEEQTSGARITQILDRIGMPKWMRKIDQGRTWLKAHTPDDASVLPYFEQIVASEAGHMYVNGDGQLVFEERHHARSDPTQSGPTLWLTDDRIADIDYQPSDDRALRNWIERASEGGARSIASDQASIDLYGRKRDSRTDLLFANPAEAADQARWVRDLLSQPIDRIDPIVIDPTFDSTHLFPVVLASTVHRRFNVVHTPSGVGDPVDVDLHIRHVQHQIAGLSWRTTVQTTPVDDRPIFTLDDPVYGLLDAGNLVSY